MKEKCGHFGWRWEKGTELLSQWFVNGEGSFSTWWQRGKGHISREASQSKLSPDGAGR